MDSPSPLPSSLRSRSNSRSASQRRVQVGGPQQEGSAAEDAASSAAPAASSTGKSLWKLGKAALAAQAAAGSGAGAGAAAPRPASGAPSVLRLAGATGEVVDMAGGIGESLHSAMATALAELTDEHAREVALQEQQVVFEAQAALFRAGKVAELTLPSGVRLHVDTPGDCTSFPYPACMLRVHYEGRVILEDGRPSDAVFDSSRNRGKPHDYQHEAGFAIAGLEQAMGFLSKGARCRIRIPHELAFKEAGFPPIIPPRAALLYDVELLCFE
jgi:FK506-binding protein 1